jgi:hypothetical protein
MVAFKVLAAAALLTSSWEPSQEQSARLHAESASALRTLVLRWEIMDRREKDDLLANPQNFAADLKLLRERFAELHDAPAVAEATRFPCKDVVSDLLAGNRAYRQELATRLEVDTIHCEELRAALLETDQLYQVWDAIRDARSEYCFVFVRRQALKRVREMIGDQAFFTGELPPYVPIWRLPLAE